MQVLSIQKTDKVNNNFKKVNMTQPMSVKPVYPQRNEISNVYYTPLNMNKQSFGGLRLETNVIQKVKGKQFQGAGIYTKGKDFIDFLKVGYEKLASEPLDIVKASKAEIIAHRFSLALAETYAEGSSFGTQWVKRYNPENRRAPLAVSHSLNSDYMKEQHYAKNLEYLYDLDNHKELDIPISELNDFYFYNNISKVTNHFIEEQENFEIKQNEIKNKEIKKLFPEHRKPNLNSLIFGISSIKNKAVIII